MRRDELHACPRVGTSSEVTSLHTRALGFPLILLCGLGWSLILSEPSCLSFSGLPPPWAGRGPFCIRPQRLLFQASPQLPADHPENSDPSSGVRDQLGSRAHVHGGERRHVPPTLAPAPWRPLERGPGWVQSPGPLSPVLRLARGVGDGLCLTAQFLPNQWEKRFHEYSYTQMNIHSDNDAPPLYPLDLGHLPCFPRRLTPSPLHRPLPAGNFTSTHRGRLAASREPLVQEDPHMEGILDLLLWRASLPSALWPHSLGLRASLWPREGSARLTAPGTNKSSLIPHSEHSIVPGQSWEAQVPQGHTRTGLRLLVTREAWGQVSLLPSTPATRPCSAGCPLGPARWGWAESTHREAAGAAGECLGLGNLGEKGSG